MRKMANNWKAKLFDTSIVFLFFSSEGQSDNKQSDNRQSDSQTVRQSHSLTAKQLDKLTKKETNRRRATGFKIKKNYKLIFPIRDFFLSYQQLTFYKAYYNRKEQNHYV